MILKINKDNFKECLNIIERKDTVTARKIERQLIKYKNVILQGKGVVELTPTEQKVLIEDKEEPRRNPKKKILKKKSVKSPLKNPLAMRTAKLRAAGLLKPSEWIGGNEFFQVKPRLNKFLEREKHGQIRMQLNPKKNVVKKLYGKNDNQIKKLFKELTKKHQELNKNYDPVFNWAISEPKSEAFFELSDRLKPKNIDYDGLIKFREKLIDIIKFNPYKKD